MAGNLWKLNTIRMLFWMQFFGAVLVPFYQEWGGLDLKQVLLLNSWFMLCNFLAEVPTGTVADYLGRKASLVFGSVVAAVAAVIYVSWRSLPSFMIAEAILGIAYTLHSGADEAIAYDSLLALGEADRSKKVLARMESFKLGGIIVAAFIGGFLAKHFGIAAPMSAYAVPALLSAVLAATLKDPPAESQRQRTSYFAVMREGSRFFIKHRVLLLLTAESAVANALAWGIIWLYQPLLEAAGMKIEFYGWVQAAACVAQIAVLANVERLEAVLGSKRRLLVGGTVAAGLAFIGLGFVSTLPFVVPLIVAAFAFGLTRVPVFSSYMNKLMPSEQRATVLSLASMVRTLGIVIVNPLIGAAADRSLQHTVIGLGVGLVLVSLVSRVEERFLLD